jgi:cystathionine beta-synthase
MVVIIPDGGRNYLSKLYNDEWMRANGLLGFEPGRSQGRALCSTPPRRGRLPEVVSPARPTRVADAIETLERYGISQMPVSEREDDAIEGIVGSISERSLLERAYRDPRSSSGPSAR